MTREEKLQLNRDRQRAVREAWANEKDLCQQGKGTVDWNTQQQAELMSRGRVSGYEGQHMKSVSQYPEYAGDKNNIQFLSHEDHLAAHNAGLTQGSGYRSPTNGYYDTSTSTMKSFGQDPPQAPEVITLSEPCYTLSSGQEAGQTASASVGQSLSAGAAQGAGAQVDGPDIGPDPGPDTGQGRSQ
jgi:hypothetical protein